MHSYAICQSFPSVDVFPHLHTFVGICRSENREPRNAAEGTSGPEPGGGQGFARGATPKVLLGAWMGLVRCGTSGPKSAVFTSGT